MRYALLCLLASLTACEGYPFPAVSDTADTADTAGEGEPAGFDLEGQWWIYTGEVPEEADLGVPPDAVRCFFLADRHVTLRWRLSEGDDWSSADYALYTPAMGSTSSYVVDLRWTWTASAADGLPTGNTGYVVIAERGAAASDFMTLGIGPCPE